MEAKLKLVDQIDEIYKDIEPSLIGCAYRYKVPNPQEVVKEWLSRAFIIADRFDKGELKKKVQVLEPSDGKQTPAFFDKLARPKPQEYDPNQHTNEDFVKSLKSYLKTAFVNDIIKQYHKRKRHNKYQTSQVHSAPSYGSGAESIDNLLDAIHLEDIIAIMEIDINRLGGNSTTVLDLVNEKFLKSIKNYCLDLLNCFGNFVVVQDVDQADNKNFFSQDFKDDLENGVRKELCKIILAEENPMLIQKLYFLIPKDKKGTLQKRIFRYFFEYHNGYPKRLRNRVKNRML